MKRLQMIGQEPANGRRTSIDQDQRATPRCDLHHTSAGGQKLSSNSNGPPPSCQT
jgi:hypothetical protein